MPTDINLDRLVNPTSTTGEWEGTGVFDVLINAVNKNIDIQYKKNRIKGDKYADVYLNGVQVVLQESMKFLLQERLTEVQIDNALKALEIKQAELDVLVENAKLAYVTRVHKDKETAALGLDGVLLNKVGATDVYNPVYEE